MDQTGLDQLIETVIRKAKTIVLFLEIGDILLRKRGKEICVDIPILYNGFALDRIHFDVDRDIFSPKGRPCSQAIGDIDVKYIKKRARELINEIEVIPAVEFREPENAWAVPLKWRRFLVAHIKIAYDGNRVIPDYALTRELKMKVF